MTTKTTVLTMPPCADPHAAEKERRLQASRAIVHRVCPLCRTSPQQLIDPGCALCLGNGAIQLGAAALSIYDPVVVAEAIALAIADNPDQLHDTIATLTGAGIMAQPTAPDDIDYWTVEGPVSHEERRNDVYALQ